MLALSITSLLFFLCSYLPHPPPRGLPYILRVNSVHHLYSVFCFFLCLIIPLPLHLHRASHLRRASSPTSAAVPCVFASWFPVLSLSSYHTARRHEVRGSPDNHQQGRFSGKVGEPDRGSGAAYEDFRPGEKRNRSKHAEQYKRCPVFL